MKVIAKRAPKDELGSSLGKPSLVALHNKGEVIRQINQNKASDLMD